MLDAKKKRGGGHVELVTQLKKCQIKCEKKNKKKKTIGYQSCYSVSFYGPNKTVDVSIDCQGIDSCRNSYVESMNEQSLFIYVQGTNSGASMCYVIFYILFGDM